MYPLLRAHHAQIQALHSRFMRMYSNAHVHANAQLRIHATTPHIHMHIYETFAHMHARVYAIFIHTCLHARMFAQFCVLLCYCQ